MKRACKSILWAIVAAWVVLSGAQLARAQAKPQDASQQGQEKSEKDQKKKKKGGGVFGGLKAVAGGGSEQQEATRTAGSKTIGEGEEIANLQPSAADRQTVIAMEGYSVPAPDLKQFQDEGKLKPQQ